MFASASDWRSLISRSFWPFASSRSLPLSAHRHGPGEWGKSNLDFSIFVPPSTNGSLRSEFFLPMQGRHVLVFQADLGGVAEDRQLLHCLRADEVLVVENVAADVRGSLLDAVALEAAVAESLALLHNGCQFDMVLIVRHGSLLGGLDG